MVLMTLSTHVLDVEAGRPVPGVPVRVDLLDGDGNTESWRPVGAGITAPDGRATDLVPPGAWAPGRWRLVFDTAAVHGAASFWPRVTIELTVREAVHHHIPLLLARHGYTTYRGS